MRFWLTSINFLSQFNQLKCASLIQRPIHRHARGSQISILSSLFARRDRCHGPNQLTKNTLFSDLVMDRFSAANILHKASAKSRNMSAGDMPHFSEFYAFEIVTLAPRALAKGHRAPDCKPRMRRFARSSSSRDTSKTCPPAESPSFPRPHVQT